MAENLTQKLMGKKLGMTQLFDSSGRAVACTVIEIEPNVVTQVKTKDTDGYNAIQIGYSEIKTRNPQTIEKRVSKPLLGHFKKAGVAPVRHLAEVRMDSVEGYTVGQKLDLAIFTDIPLVDVTAVSIGKGYQGVMKLYNFRGGPAAHGSGFHRLAGSTGMRSTPGRSLPGGKRACHMGSDRKTVENLEVLKIQDNLILVKGQVPGPKNGLVTLRPAMKKRHDMMMKKK